MELLGAYSSQLTPAYYQQLLALLDAAISSGDLSGGSAFNQNALLALEQQAQSFDQLPTGTSGSRVTDDSFNYPFRYRQHISRPAGGGEDRMFAQLGTAQNYVLSLPRAGLPPSRSAPGKSA